jgi:hypothetical protein
MKSSLTKRVLVAAMALGGLGAGALVAAPAQAKPATTVKVVTHSGQAGWKSFRQCYDVNGNPLTTVDPSDTVTFVKGPATPPGPTGSLQLATGSGTSGGDCQSALRNTNYVGTKVADLTSLGYWTYMAKNNGQQFPILTLNINYSGGTSTTVDDTLFLEPPYQNPVDGNPTCPDQGKTVLNTWQQWDALHGCWWSNTGNFGNPGTGVLPLSVLLAAHPNATVVNSSGIGGLRVFVGEASPTDSFQGNVDLLTIAVKNVGITYNFNARKGHHGGED